MKHRVEDLSGAALDGAVLVATSFNEHAIQLEWLLERYQVAVVPYKLAWMAYVGGYWLNERMEDWRTEAAGTTPAEAAKRAVVVHTMGAEVDLP